VDGDRLRRLLREIDATIEVIDDDLRLAADARLAFVESSSETAGKEDVVVLPTDADGSLEMWIASTAARRFRRVPDADRCASPGLDDVLATGLWRRADFAELPEDAAYGVLVVKPGIDADADFLRAIAERAAECGYGIIEARAIPAARVSADGLARLHYRSHCAFAEHGRLTPAERAALLRAYDTPEFEPTYGRRARVVPVEPVERFIARTGVARDVIRRWSDASTAAGGIDSATLDGPTELGDDKYVNLFRIASVRLFSSANQNIFHGIFLLVYFSKPALCLIRRFSRLLVWPI
jgi:hypothetical protein